MISHSSVERTASLCVIFLVLLVATGCAAPVRVVGPPAYLDPAALVRVVRYLDADGSVRFGLVKATPSGLGVLPLEGDAADGASMVGLLRSRGRLAPKPSAEPLDFARLAAEGRIQSPVPRPRHFVAVAVNYAGHARETGSHMPERPAIYSKAPETIAGPFDPIPLDRDDALLDYEVELGVVIAEPIARGTRFASPRKLLDHIAGFVLVNDVTYRDDQLLYGQWWIGKSHERSAPVGPFLVLATPAVIEASLARGFPNIELSLSVMPAFGDRWEERQREFADAMHFDVVEVVNAICEAITLLPGDLITTGTSAGPAFRPGGLKRRLGELLIGDAGKRRRIFVDGQRRALAKPGATLYLRHGDRVRASSPVLGEQMNRVERRARPQSSE